MMAVVVVDKEEEEEKEEKKKKKGGGGGGGRGERGERGGCDLEPVRVQEKRQSGKTEAKVVTADATA